MEFVFYILLIIGFIRMLPIMILFFMIVFSKDDKGKRGGGLDRYCNDHDVITI